MEEKDKEQFKKERDEYLAGWQRAKADFLNYKKGQEASMQSMAAFARLELLLRIFPIFDNLERALKQVPEEEKNNQIYKGLLQIEKQWKEFLKTQEVKEIEAAGKPFDPEFHEAIDQVESGEAGIVVEEVEKGYTIYNQVLRPAKVKVTK